MVVNLIDENKKEQGTPEDAGEGDQPKATTLYEQTNIATERLENANAKTEELLNRQEEIYQRQQLGGTSEAGQTKEPEFSDEEKASRSRIKAIADASGASWGKNYE